MAANKKEIREFDLDVPLDDAQFIFQTAGGVTKKALKTGILNDVNTSLVGLQSQIDDINTNTLGISGGIIQVDTLIDDKLEEYVLKALEKQIDDDSSDSTICYLGEADPGSDTSDAVWRIKRIVDTGDSISVEWADGNGNFDNVYDDREGLSYT
jgi:hypothetical protein